MKRKSLKSKLSATGLTLALILSIVASGTGASANDFEIPADSIIQDVAFYKAVIELLSKTNGDTILASDVESIELLNINKLGIKDLRGIEHFTALLYLDCSGNELTTIDISKNTALQQLNRNSNKLTELDLSNNTLLKYLLCHNNQLTELDVSMNTALVNLSCFSNKLSNLDISKNLALEELYCGVNNLSALDVSSNPELVILNCYKNELKTLDVSKNPKLDSLSCGWNNLTALDISRNVILNELFCSYNYMNSTDDVVGWQNNANLILGETFVFNPQRGEEDYDNIPIYSIETFVTRFYRTFLSRSPSAEELEAWYELIEIEEMTGIQVAYGFFFSVEFTENATNMKPEEFILLLYNSMLGRMPSTGELALWVDIYEGGASVYELFRIAAMSGEFLGLCRAAKIERGEYWLPTENTIEGFVIRAYNLCLSRYPDNDEMQDWIDSLIDGRSTGKDIVFGFTNSEEFLKRRLGDRAYIEILYNVLLGRPAAPSDKEYWMDLLKANTRNEVLSIIADSEEFTGICNEYGIKP